MEIDSCSENCHDTVGSYTCSCNVGYTLNSNGFTCDGTLTFECVVKLVSSYTLILQTSTNAVQIPPIPASMPASIPLDRTLVVVIMDMCLIQMDKLVEVSSVPLCIMMFYCACHELVELLLSLYNEFQLGKYFCSIIGSVECYLFAMRLMNIATWLMLTF